MKGKNSFLKKNRHVSFALAMIAALLVYTGVLAAGEILDPNFGANGIATTTFGGVFDGTNQVTLQTDGKIIVSGLHQSSTPFVARYNSNGTVDTSFGTNGSIVPLAGSRVAVQADGKILVGGSNQGSMTVARYTSNGAALDTAFGTNGAVTFPTGSDFDTFSLSDLIVQPDQKVVLVGTQAIGNFTNFVIVRLNTDGTPDETFVSNGFRILDYFDFPNNRFNAAKAVAIQSDGKIVMSGDMLDNDAHRQITLARLNTNGSLDTTAFGTNGKGTVITPLANFYQSRGALVLQSNGKIVMAGTIDNEITTDLAMARFNSNGSLDTTFGGTGIVVTDFGSNERSSDLVLQTDGKIIVVGKISGSDFSDILLVRYNSDGSLDDSFGVNGKIIKDIGGLPDSGNGLVLQPDGKIVLAGSSNGTALLARYIISIQPPQTVTFKSSGPHDGWVLESGENTNSGGSLNKSATTILVGDDAKDKQYRGILSFNTISIPDNAVVTSARVDIKRQGFVGTNPFNTHGNLLMEIRAGTFSNNLALQLNDFRAAATPGAANERFLPLTSVWYAAEISNASLVFINKYGFTQFRLRYTLDDNDDMNTDHLKFFSGESINANRPRLVITYFVP